MPSERVQRQIDRLLDQAEQALEQGDLDLAREKARLVLGMDAENADALTYLAAVESAQESPIAHQPGPAAVPQSPTPSLQPPAPTSFCDGRYQVVRFLGEGGKKRVYLAHDAKLDRDVAFALIKTDGLDDDGLLRIKREAQAMGRLGDHPHIVSVYDIGELPSAGIDLTPAQPFLVTQLMAGGDLEGAIQKAPDHRLPFDRALLIADQVCQALEYAHGKGIIHRDLKPGNVWLTADPDPQSPTPSPQPPPVAKLGDFGLAFALDRARLTQAGMMVGTVSYMPPEQALGGEVTPRSDLSHPTLSRREREQPRPPLPLGEAGRSRASGRGRVRAWTHAAH